MINFYFIVLSLLIGQLQAISIDLSLGEALNIKQEIKVNSDSFKTTAKTKGFQNPQYYSVRLRKDRLELELVHHKLYIENNLPSYINHLELTDGYNLLLLNYTSPFKNNLHYRFGLGVPVVHPDITIQGDEVNLDSSKRLFERGGGLIPKFWKEGYYPGGITSQLSLFYRKEINEKIAYHIETKVVYAKTQFDLSYIDDDSEELNLDITIPNLSFHFLVGISFGKQ